MMESTTPTGPVLLFNYYSALGSIPIKLMNARPISPVSKNAIPSPLRGPGTALYLIFSLMAAIAIIAKNQPNPPPRPNATDSEKLYSFDTINNDPPSMAQFTVIRGKNIPNELYSDGENFSTTISTNCTIDAMTAINNINLKKVRSVLKTPVSASRNVLIIQLIGIVIPSTKMTASPRPNAVFTVLDTARYEHIPRK